MVRINHQSILRKVGTSLSQCLEIRWVSWIKQIFTTRRWRSWRNRALFDSNLNTWPFKFANHSHDWTSETILPCVRTEIACPIDPISVFLEPSCDSRSISLGNINFKVLYRDGCKKIERKENYFNVLHISSAVMASGGSMLKEEFGSPNIDYICRVPRPVCTTVNNLIDREKFLGSSTSFPCNFLKFWTTLISLRRCNCKFFPSLVCPRLRPIHVSLHKVYFFGRLRASPNCPLRGSLVSCLLKMEAVVIKVGSLVQWELGWVTYAVYFAVGEENWDVAALFVKKVNEISENDSVYLPFGKTSF